MKYYVRAVWKFTEKCEIDHSMFTNSVMQLLYYEPPWLVWVLFEGPAIYLTITSVVQVSWLSAFHSKCSFLPPRDQRDVFVVCCSIHIPAPSSLPSFLGLPLLEASPSSLRHKSLMCAHTHSYHHSSDELPEPVSCFGHDLAFQQLPASHFWGAKFTTSSAVGFWVIV